MRVPQRLREAFHEGVLEPVCIREPRQQLRIEPAHAGRAVRPELLADRDMQAHVQERIRPAGFGRELALQRVRGLEHGVILGVLLDDLREDALQGLERLPGARFRPGLHVGPAQVVAVASVQQRSTRSPCAGTRTDRR